MKLRSRSLQCLFVLIAAAGTATADDGSRQDEVRSKGAEVMPFSLDQTQHVFDKTDTGGMQRVVARNGSTGQRDMIRGHLHEIARSFEARNFDKPMHIHGADMPGLAEMKAAGAAELEVIYSDFPDGAQITYSSPSPKIVAAIHRWFDAQLSDHGSDAMSHDNPVPAKSQ